MEKETLENLLNQISAINNKYSEIAKITGENFNIFKILKVVANEVRTHSAFLAELLNPNGSHGQGDVFLKIFLAQLELNDFTCENAKVETEKWLGYISDDHSTGGYIDIFLTDKNNKHIIIENKIYARDQFKQLARYHNEDPKAKLYYLTLELDDKKPDISSIKDENTGKILKKDTDFFTISYKDDIKNWLELCKKEAVNFPLIRETITQYINLIKYLTHQAMNDKEEQEIIEQILKSPEKTEAAYVIAGIGSDKITKAIIEKLKEKLNGIAKELGLKFGSEKEKFSGWFFEKESKYRIEFFFEEDEEDKEPYGILLLGIKMNENSKALSNYEGFIQNKLNNINIGNNISNDEGYKKNGFICVYNFEKWDCNWKDINEKMPTIIKETIKEILKSLEGIDLSK